MFVFKVVNPHLLKDLHDRKLWDDNLKHQLLNNMGSVQVGNLLDIRYQTFSSNVFMCLGN